VPPVLRNRQKCQACGFPVSQGRTFCVECEERQWRGQRLAQPDARTGAAGEKPPGTQIIRAQGGLATPAPVVADVPQIVPENVPRDSHTSALFLGSAAPSESWFAANKYILGALLVVGIVIGAIVWLR